MFDFVCEKCGAIQKPTHEGKNFNTFINKCYKCGGKLTIQRRQNANTKESKRKSKRND